MCIGEDEIKLINSKPEVLIGKIKSKMEYWKSLIGMLSESETILTPQAAVKTAETITEIMVFETLIHTRREDIKIPDDVFDDLKESIEEFIKVSDELVEIESENGGNLEFCMEVVPDGGEIDLNELNVKDIMIHIPVDGDDLF